MVGHTVDINNEYYDKVIRLNGIEELRNKQWNYQTPVVGSMTPLKRVKNIAGTAGRIGLVTLRKTVSRGTEVVVAARNEDVQKQMKEEVRKHYLKARNRPLLSTMTVVGVVALALTAVRRRNN